MIAFIFSKTPLLFFVQSFWRDEAFTYLLAKQNILNIFITTAKDFNPPLYYFLVHFWMKLFGGSEISLRTISLLFYFATIYMMYLFIKHVFKIKPPSSIFYLLLSILNPLLLYYAFEARMYTMLAFFATLSSYSFLKKRNGLYLISTILGLYTHYFMVFAVLIQLAYSFLFERKRSARKNLYLYFLLFIFFLPWILVVANLKELGNESFWIEKSSLLTFLLLPGIIFTGFENSLRFYHKEIIRLSLGLFTFLGYGIFCLREYFKSKKTYLLYVVLWGIGLPFFVALVSFIKPIFLPRYLIFCVVGFLLFIISTLKNTPKLPRILIYLLLIGVSLNFHIQQVKNRKKSDLRRIIREIKYLAGPNDMIYVINELDYFPAQYYFNERKVYIYGKTYEEIPNYVGKVLIPKSKFINTLPIFPQKAFILTSDSHYEIQSAR